MMKRDLRLSGLLLVCCLIYACGGNDEVPVDDAAVTDDGGYDVIEPADNGETGDAVRDVADDVGSDFGVDVGGDIPSQDTYEPSCPAGTACDDGDSCTIDDVCGDDGETCAGTVVAGCDDGLDCTADSCAAADDCANDLRPGWCLVDGLCVADGDFSTVNTCMACITALAVDRLFPDDNGTCDDGDACTLGDSCSAGACVATPMDCDDDNPCTADSCAEGVCNHGTTDGAVCDDGNACTADDVCAQDVCGGMGVDCDDANLCTDDTCDPEFGCVNTPNSVSCEDGNSCTTGDACFAGECASGNVPLTCDDENVCTTDGCVPSKGCVAIPNTEPCDDGDPCTLNDTCSASVCQAGKLPLECDDNNGCTNEECVAFVGCQYTNNTDVCDDSNECTVGDQCGGGVCVPGAGEVDCDDNNVCTDDACVQGEGCVNLPNADECDDNNVCTGMGTCSEGECVRGAYNYDCDDGRECTTDSCDPVEGCEHSIVNSADCRPQVVVDFPERAATLDGARDITILGHVDLGLDDEPVPFVTVNGTQVGVMPDNTFSVPTTSAQGFNGIVVEAEDLNGLKDRVVQSYYYSTQWFPFSETDPTVSNVDDGLMLFLGPEVWDDNDTSTYDDIATILTQYVSTMDLMSMITNPVERAYDNWACGTHTINITGITFGAVSVDLTPVDGGLSLRITIPNLWVGLSGTYCHVSFTGNATASSVVVTSTLLIAMDTVTGKPVITMSGTDSTVNGLDVDLNGAAGVLADVVMFFMEGTLTDKIETTIEDKISSIIPQMQEMLEGLAIDQTFEVPALFDGGTPTTISMASSLSSVLFTPAGGTLGMKAAFSAPKGTTYEKLGSIGRANCLADGVEANPTFPVGSTDPQLELGLKDDLLNELVYSLYWAGALNLPIPASMFGDSLADYGVTDMTMNVDFMLPPILSACNPEQKLNVAVGDVKVDASLKLFGAPLTMTIYASLKAAATITAGQDETGATVLGVAVEYPEFVDMEIASLEGSLSGAEDTIKGLVMDTLMPQLLVKLDGVTPLFEFAIPSIDMADFIDGVPAGSELSILVSEVLRAAAFTVASGDVQ